ncbi:MAG: lipocalin-like domain-containing protein [Bacteroidaceae bacterium]|nr:lipocalin-like domain-containing protein [Bacteroidaceae bacterium]
MKRIIYIFLSATLLLSCQKADDNGDLGGFWKLLKIEDVATGTIENTKEYKRFWCIQLDLLTTMSEDDDSYNSNYGGKGRFQHVGNSLYIQMIEKRTDLTKVGIHNPENERFGVVLLNSDKMILRSDKVQLDFRKF